MTLRFFGRPDIVRIQQSNDSGTSVCNAGIACTRYAMMKQAWRATQNERSPFISFDCDDGVHVFVIRHIKEAELIGRRLRMWWNKKVIEFEGSSLLQFLNDFTEERVNHI
jgi:hypothetical protein